MAVNINAANISSVRFDEQASTPSTPAAGFSAIYMKTDGLYAIDDAGNVTGPLVASVSALHRAGLQVNKLDNDTLIVGIGSVTVAGTLIENNETQVIDLATAGNWIGGASLESASEWVHVYADIAGNFLLSDKHPNYPKANTNARICEARVNQAGWNGTAGLGLNATSMVYDDGAGGQPANEANILVGMFVQVYTDSVYTTGRGKGTGGAGSVNNLSIAKITAVNTGTNTLTLDAGHQIAINDNDYLVVVEAGAMIYAYISNAWYRWIGAIYNDSGGNLTMQYANSYAYILNEIADLTTSSASFVDVIAAFAFTLFTQGEDVNCSFAGSGSHGTTGKAIWFDIEVDGTRKGGDDGINFISQHTNGYALNFSFPYPIIGLLPGTHKFALQWKTNLATATMWAGAGTSGADMHPQFSVREEGKAV
jgi:hypothetical protein